jgi:hypothetical protein
MEVLHHLRKFFQDGVGSGQRTRFPMNRRHFIGSSSIAAGGFSLAMVGLAKRRKGKVISLFDGKTLRGWKQIENSAASLSASQIANPAGLIDQLAKGADGLSVYLRSQLDPGVKESLGTSSDSPSAAKPVLAAAIKNLNQIIAGPALYKKSRFEPSISLRPETEKLLHRDPHGYQLAELNKLLIEDAYPTLIAKAALTGWTVRDGAMTSEGAGRGVIYTERDFSRFRLMFTMRHVSGNPDHQACVLIFCTRPQSDEKPLDALGGIQFQVPNGGHWDYRPGMNQAGGGEFVTVTKGRFDPHQWSRIEILADAAQGTARMAVAQPLESKAIEVLDFKDPAAGKIGPIAWQMHNAGLFDEYKDVSIESDPPDDKLITVT